jgi:hypothetical protein
VGRDGVDACRRVGSGEKGVAQVYGGVDKAAVGEEVSSERPSESEIQVERSEPLAPLATSPKDSLPRPS